VINTIEDLIQSVYRLSGAEVEALLFANCRGYLSTPLPSPQLVEIHLRNCFLEGRLAIVLLPADTGMREIKLRCLTRSIFITSRNSLWNRALLLTKRARCTGSSLPMFLKRGYAKY
jgi:hypothetical protein